jgi:hypothetical protein
MLKVFEVKGIRVSVRLWIFEHRDSDAEEIYIKIEFRIQNKMLKTL